MTANVITLLERIKDLEIFETHPLYFVGGTALAYYLEHRISEDIDIISAAPLPHRQITNTIMALGGTKLKDANAMALRLAGLFPDEPEFKSITQFLKTILNKDFLRVVVCGFEEVRC